MSSSQRGHFNNLRQFVAFGFEIGNNKLNKQITSELEEGGIFSFDQNDKQKIDLLRLRGQGTTELKRINMIAYQIELTYDLAISRCDNVSENPGFKWCLSIW